MQEKLLHNLIKQIEFGTNLNIGVLFFENFGNRACELPLKQTIHRSPMCEYFKNNGKRAFERCYKCRNLAIKKALETKKPFEGLCINGIYEYTHPVCIQGHVAFLIFIGNILNSEKGVKKIKRKANTNNLPLNTMEKSVSPTDCQSIAKTIENYVLYLLEKYPDEEKGEKLIIKNIKSYINDNLEFDISIETLAELFHYNSRYLGRLFKKETGLYISDYIIHVRIENAKKLLDNTNQSIIFISNEIGFNNVTYFNKIFKQFTGLTPTEYRKSKR